MADALKAKGNACFQAGNYEEAIKHFTDAINLDPSNHVLYSNRSASLASLSQFDQALDDAKKVVELKCDWPKGYSRLGAAHQGLGNWDDAIQAYKRGLELDPNNDAMRQSLKDAEQAKAGGGGAGAGGGMGGLFSSPDFFSRLATNPQTRAFLGQPDFMAMLQDVGRNPQNMSLYLGDERFQSALGVGLGINLAAPGAGMRGAGGAGAGAQNGSARASAAAAAGGDEESDEDMPDLEDVPEAPGGASAAAPEPAPAREAPPPPPPQQEEDPEEAARKQAHAAALAEKEKGNEAYKARRFEEALAHYGRAMELNDQDISFLTNRAAVHYEMGNNEACIRDCDEAVEKGREQRADYKIIARALTRKGNALARSGQLQQAIDTYRKALTEHRNPDTLKRLQEAEKKLKEDQIASYINQDVSNEEKDKGNEAFKEQRYPDAVKHYTEALARGPPSHNPEAYKLYSNRAACYTKLGAWNEGLRDAEECIRLAPAFAKGYSRKGHLQYFMKEYDKALATYEEGLKNDPNNEELKEGIMRCMEAISKFARGEASEDEVKARREKAMADPEIQTILTDPIMRQVLQDFQENPKAAQQHLKAPHIMEKINKLVAAGIVQMR